MSHWSDEPRYGNEVVAFALPAFWPALAVSLLLHLAVLLLWLPRTNLLASWEDDNKPASERLQVRIAAAAPVSPAPTVAVPQVRMQPVQPARHARPLSPQQPANSQASLPAPSPPAVTPQGTPAPPTLPIETTAPGTMPLPRDAAAGGDLWSYIQAKRLERSRAESGAPPALSDQPRLNDAIAANLPAPATGVATRDTKRAGGVFQIKRMAYDDAAFEFYGWNATMQRLAPQIIEVRLGNNSDMRIAVVRRMIALIREQTKDEFIWRSVKHDRDYTLSARLPDNAALEDFLMREFFEDPVVAH
jgi:hypothetical protein